MGEDTIIVAIVFGSILGMITIPMLISLAKKWIESNNGSFDEENFNRMAQAFIKHKKDTEQRIQHLEAIIKDENDEELSSSQPALDHTKEPPIEIEDESRKKEEKANKSNNLKNILKE